MSVAWSESGEPSGEVRPLVAVVEDDRELGNTLRRWLTAEGFETVVCTRAAEVLALSMGGMAAVCLDLHLPDASGLDVLATLHAADADLPVIIATAVSDVDTAVTAMRAGAYDYVVKPLRRDQFLAVVRRAVDRRTLSNRILQLQGTPMPDRQPLVGTSAPMRELARQIDRVRDSDVTVCITGESGTGKELVARAIHAGSRRRSGPFVAINCAAVPQAIQESELFGHERGAFTGAMGLHRGRFEQADGGTLFLDELGEMNPATQASLLRVLTMKSITRVGGGAEIPVDVRVISATHRDLPAEVRAGRFREDLYYRLVVYPIAIAPLRARTHDIPALIAHFLARFRTDVGRDIRRLSPDALDALVRHPWPGNVRELESVIHRAMLSCDGPEITTVHLPPLDDGHAGPPTWATHGPPPPPRGTPITPRPPSVTARARVSSLREVEQRAIQDALQASGGSVPRAAQLLGMSRATLYRRLAAMDARGTQDPQGTDPTG